MEEFYVNGSSENEVISTKVRDIALTYEVDEISQLLGFINEGALNFKGVDVKQGLEFMGIRKTHS